MSLRVSAIIFQLFKVIMPEKCALTILELNWNQRLGQDKIEHLSSYAHVVHTTAKQVISRRRKNENFCKMSKNEKCTCKACRNTVFHCQICKFEGFLLPSSSWLLKPGLHDNFKFFGTVPVWIWPLCLKFATRHPSFLSCKWKNSLHECLKTDECRDHVDR